MLWANWCYYPQYTNMDKWLYWINYINSGMEYKTSYNATKYGGKIMTGLKVNVFFSSHSQSRDLYVSNGSMLFVIIWAQIRSKKSI